MAYTSVLMSETLFTCVLVLLLAALVRYDRTLSLTQLTLAGLLLAAATFVRPITYFLPPVMALVLFVQGLRRFDTFRRAALAGAVFFIAAMGPLAGWQVRNWLTTGYAGFSSISAMQIYFYQGGSVLAEETHHTLAEMHQAMGYASMEQFLDRHPELRDASRADVLRFMQSEGSRLVRQHPLTYANIHLRGMAMLLLNPNVPSC